MKLIVLTIVQGLLEMTGTVGLSLVLARAGLSWKRAFLVGTGLFIVVQVFRHLPLFFGLHTLVGLLALTVYLVRGQRVTLLSGFTAAFLSLFALGLVEFVSNAVILGALHLDARLAAANQEEWALIGLPQGIMMIVLAWIAGILIKPQRSRRQHELSGSEPAHSKVSRY